MENRRIATKPVSTVFSSNFFKEFEAWYNDRILGRKNLIRLWSSVNGKLFNVLISKEVVLGKDGYLFQVFNLSRDLVDEQEKLNVLKDINDLCKSKNIRFTVFIVPPSEWVFPELLPEKYTPVDLENIELNTSEFLKQEKIDYCFISNDILEESFSERKSMYYVGDSHWNAKGAYYGAKKLLKHLSLDSTINSEIYYKQEISYGDIYTKKIGWDPIKSVVDVPWSDRFTENVIRQCNIEGTMLDGVIDGASQKGEVIYTNSNAGNKIKVLILGDSFYNAMWKYVSQDVSTVIFSHNCDVTAPKTSINITKMIERYQPDMVVYEKVGSNFYEHTFIPVFGYYEF